MRHCCYHKCHNLVYSSTAQAKRFAYAWFCGLCWKLLPVSIKVKAEILLRKRTGMSLGYTRAGIKELGKEAYVIQGERLTSAQSEEPIP